MATPKFQAPATHTSAWIAQTWLAFLLSLAATTIGIYLLPINGWVKGYLGMGYIFSISSTISMAKTTRDIEESKRIVSRVDEAKLEKLLAEYDPFTK
ncbi:YiaAB two helix domain-containing protein [[Leptolyngbya] sp. PCC 7376]|uniref:YiaA/YiaB family inner membrane protein n=1 Tax=[Leptolyngbya] sp. PCC 7376 TaxID=111781 RepID=UPI00029EF1EB|nr:YiaA/YiaB family inner membrane protein [[Leptolyngbya] sp. PCC 7376]AFY39752.1 YiaAB two helix domain-containing protein [[Leptolyngbya] sp. PCC 7376]